MNSKKKPPETVAPTDELEKPAIPYITIYSIMPRDPNGGWFNHLIVCERCLYSQPCRDWQETVNWAHTHKCAWHVLSAMVPRVF